MKQTVRIKENEQKIMKLAQIAQKSILTEAFLHPKPGLVDLNDNGAHTDMDISTFIKSSISLFPGFLQFAEKGFSWGLDEKSLFEVIRPIGKKSEQEMFYATNGVNTHKGIIFSMGIFITAFSYLLNNNQSLKKENAPILLQNTIQKMTVGLVKKDFSNKKNTIPLSNGEKAFFEQGLLGIRGEAENGYPTVVHGSLPYYQFLFTKNISETERSLKVLLYLMIHTEDTNVMNRGGIAGYHFLKKRAHEVAVSGLGGFRFIQEMTKFNEDCKKKNISPGGAADLLSVTYFLHDSMNYFC